MSTRSTTKTHALSHLSRCSSSGLSKVQYCHKNNLSVSTFYSWQKRYRGSKTSNPASLDSLSFVELSRADSSTLSPSLRSIRILHTAIEIPLGSPGFNASDILPALMTYAAGDRKQC